MGTTKEVFGEGEVVFKEGDPGNVMYIIQSGEIHIKKTVEGGEKLLKVVDAPHDFFGEMSLLDGSPRSATAVAAAHTNLITVDKVSFENLILNNGKFALKIIKILSERIRSSNLEISELVSEDLYERICRGLADYAKETGEKIYTGKIKLNVLEARNWLNSNMGISTRDFEANIYKMLKNQQAEYAATSAKSKEDILLTQEFITKYASHT